MWLMHHSHGADTARCGAVVCSLCSLFCVLYDLDTRVVCWCWERWVLLHDGTWVWSLQYIVCFVWSKSPQACRVLVLRLLLLHGAPICCAVYNPNKHVVCWFRERLALLQRCMVLGSSPCHRYITSYCKHLQPTAQGQTMISHQWQTSHLKSPHYHPSPSTHIFLDMLALLVNWDSE